MTELLKLHPLKQELVNEILYQSQPERRSDSQSELKNKHLRVQLVQIHGSASSSSSRSSSRSSSYPSSSQTAIAPSVQLDESNEDLSKRQKVTHGADMELEGLVMESERDRLQRYSDCDFLMHVKQNADAYHDRIFSDDNRKRRNCEERI